MSEHVAMMDDRKNRKRAHLRLTQNLLPWGRTLVQTTRSNGSMNKVAVTSIDLGGQGCGRLLDCPWLQTRTPLMSRRPGQAKIDNEGQS